MPRKGGGRGGAASQRQLRVGEEMRHVIAALFLRGEFRDPALIGVSLTVSEVRVSPDLKNATAFVLPLGPHDEAAVFAALNRAATYVRGEVAQAMRLRHVPRIDFKRDDSFDEAQRIDRLFKDPKVAADLAKDDDDA
jgi:ribosome-binding factor A